MQPSQLISLMEYQGVPFAWAQGDHADHVHVGWPPLYNQFASRYTGGLKPEQWLKLIDRINHIDNPAVPTRPSPRAARAGNGD